jgi:hypothetical protein
VAVVEKELRRRPDFPGQVMLNESREYDDTSEELLLLMRGFVNGIERVIGVAASVISSFCPL